MSDLIVIIFDKEEDAHAVRDTLRQEERQGLLKLADAAVVSKDLDGKVHIKNETDSGVKIGAVGGSLLGLLIASVFFPIGGLIIGGLIGAGIGAAADIGIEKKFVKEVAEKLEPGKSALFILVKEANMAAELAALRPYHGQLLQTSLDSEDEEALRAAVEKGK